MVGFFKYFVIALILFAGYNEFAMMHRPYAFDKLVQHQSKAEVADAISEARYSYQCGSGQPVALYPYIDRLCVANVQEVDAYPLCYVQVRCHGWNYVAFDKDGKLVAKYFLDN